jgi:hypothetical protein
MTLHFYAATVADIITPIQFSEFPSLKKFDMLVSALCRTETEQLRHALTQFKAFPTIKHIDIQVSPFPYFCSHEFGDFLGALNHILSFVQLLALHLTFRLPICVESDLLLQDISSWPHIYILELDTRRPTVTFRGLLSALPSMSATLNSRHFSTPMGCAPL